MSENRVKRAIDTDLSGLRTTAWQREQIVQYAMEGHSTMRYASKMKTALALALVLVMVTAVTALAVGLSSYFDGFMTLEEEYGEYEQWPGSAKAQLVELMLESGALTAEDVPQWRDDLTGEAKEAAAEEILASYFDGMFYIDAYNVMERELGPIDTWTEEQRAMLTELQEKHGTWTPSWPAYKLPGTGDLTRDQAAAQARQALLAVFDIDEDYVNGLAVEDAVFRAEWNRYGIPEDEPYWSVQIGKGYDYHLVNMTRLGEIISLQALQTGDLLWGEDIMAQSTLIEPSEHDATREEAILSSRDALTELGSFSLTDAEVGALTPTARLMWNEHYQNGWEPVWIVTWSQGGEPKYQVLLTYDAKLLDAVHYGKLFRNVLRDEPHLDSIVADMVGTTALALGNLCSASFEEQAAFYERFKPFADAYAAEHPYFPSSEAATVMVSWQYTRNRLGVPDEHAISADEALALGLKALEEKYDQPFSADDWTGLRNATVYIVTDPEHPQYRFSRTGFRLAIDAYTGEVLVAEAESGWYRSIDAFVGEIIE